MVKYYATAIYALWRRDVCKLVRQRSRLLSGLAQPLMYLLALGLGLNSIFRAAGYGDYTRFLTPGVITMSLMTSAFISGISVLWDRKFGFLKETLVAPLPRFCVVFGRTLGAATAALVQGIFILALSYILGVRIPVSVIIPAIVTMLLVGALFASTGVLCGAIIEDFQSIQLIVSLILMPLFFLSGALFPIGSTSNLTLDMIVRLNPLSYCVDAIREILFDQSHFGLPLDLTIVLSILVMSLMLGSSFFTKVKVS